MGFILLLALLSCGLLHAQTPDGSFNPVANNFVHSLAMQADGKILMGGGFTSVGGTSRNRIARLNADGSLDSSFNPNANEGISSMSLQADGKILIGGVFSTVGGVTRNRIARLNSDSSLDNSFNPDANSYVLTLAVQADGRILIGGLFTTMGGVTRNRIARINADGTLDNSFDPSANGTVESLAIQEDGKILMGGGFTSVGGTSRNRIARVNADGSLDSSFNPNAENDVSCLAVQSDGKILVGGYFTTVGGVTRNRIARINADGTLDNSFNPDLNGHVHTLAVQADGKILMGGGFSTVGGVPRSRIARLNPDGTLANSFNLSVDNNVTSLALQADGKVLMGGYFNSVDGVPRSCIARLTNDIDATSALVVSNPTQIDWTRGGSAPELEQVTFETWNGNSWVSLGGAARVTGGWRKTDLSFPASGQIRARGRSSGGNYNGSSGIIEQVATYTTPPDIALEAPTGTTVSNGIGTLAYGQVAPGQIQDLVCTLRNSGGVDLTGITPNISGTDAALFTLVSPPPSSLAAGASANFTVRFAPTSAGAKNATLSIASNDPDENPFAVDLSGSGTSVVELETSFNPGSPYGTVYALAVQADGKILMGGTFTNPGQEAHFRIARLRADGTLDGSFKPSANDMVYSLVVETDGKILMAGRFTTVNGVARNRIARLNADGTLESSFDPNANNYINSLALQSDGKILMGGQFTSVGGVARNRIARLNADGSLDSTFNPNASSTVSSLATQPDGKILMGGGFSTVGGAIRNRIARLNADGTLDSAFNPNANGEIRSFFIQPDGKILVGGGFTAVGGVTRNYAARLNADGTLDINFNPNANERVNSLAVQADGKILMGGQFTAVGGATRNYTARLNTDGTPDGSFNPNVGDLVYSLALQVDGKILMGGDFTTVGGVNRYKIARLTNDTAATSTLAVSGNTQINWNRGGSTPELEQVTFENWNGSAWVSLGSATRVSGGWQKNGLSLSTAGWVRARGRASGGQYNGSSGIIEQIEEYGSPASPNISVTVEGFGALDFGSAIVDFGTVLWPSHEDVTKAVTITNSGNATLSGLSLAMSGFDVGDFYTTALSSTTLAPGESVVFDINFLPQGSGSKGGLLTIVSNDPDGSPFPITMVGRSIQTDPLFNPNANNEVYSIAAQTDGKVLIGGNFTLLSGVVRNYMARLNADGTVDNSFNPDVNGKIISTTIQTDGRILIAGGFTTVGGVARNRIARLNVDGTLDTSFNPNADNEILALAVQADDKILVAGKFTLLGGSTRSRIARINPDGTLDGSFYPSSNSDVNSLAIQADGRILIGGNFTTVSGVTRARIARLYSDGTLDSSFNPVSNDAVSCLAIQADGKILMGGYFTTVNGSARSCIARLNSNGILDSTFNLVTNSSIFTNTVHTIALQTDGRILIGGTFCYETGLIPRNSIARLNADGTLDSSFEPDARIGVYSLALQADGRILMGGYIQLTAVDGVARNRIARLTNDTPATSTLAVSGITQIDWMRGGSSPELEQVTFENWNGSAWVRLGSATRVSGGWQKTGLSLSSSGWVRARGRTSGGQYNGSSGVIEQIVEYGSPASPDITVEAVGTGNLAYGSAAVDFGTVLWPATGSVTRTLTVTNSGNATLAGIALAMSGAAPGDFSTSALSSTTLAPGASVSFTITFAPQAVGPRGALLSITSNDPNETPFPITLSGLFAHADPSFNPDASDIVYTVAEQPDGKTLMAGTFSSVGGVTRYRIARINPNGTLDNSFSVTNNNSVFSLAVQADGNILVAGGFSTMGGLARNRIARLNSDGSLDVTFDPNANGTVNSLAVQADGKILIAGSMTTVGGITRNRIARLNGDGTLDNSFNPDANGTVNSLVLQADGMILIGGQFTTVGGVTRNRIARLNADGFLDPNFNPNSNGFVNCLATQADGKILIGGQFTTMGGLPRNNVARLNVNGSLDSPFNPNANERVFSMAVQADGKIQMGGWFTTVGGVVRNRIARLNPDGTLDSSFTPNADNNIYALTINADGNVLIGGSFTSVAGVVRNRIARLMNNPAVISTVAVSGTTQIDWTRGGSAPEVEQVTFENWNGSTWEKLGNATRVPGGWRMTGLALPPNGQIRARGRSSGGYYNGSSGIVEEIAIYPPPPDISLEAPTGTVISSGSGTLDFGQVAPGQFRDLVCTLRNTGGSALTDIVPTVIGTNASLFTMVSPPPSFLGAGTSANFAIRFSPISTIAGSATLSIASNDPDENPFSITISGTGATSETSFNSWASTSGLTGPDSAPDAIPFNDGVPNLLKYAFNMNAGGPDVSVLGVGGSSGLPLISIDESGATPVLKVVFLRRKDSGLIYTPQRSTTLDGFVAMIGTQTVTSINDQWERVTVEEVAPQTSTSSSFARVLVRLP